MPRIIHLILKFGGIFLRGLRFSVVNRDIRPQLVLSCLDYWRLAMQYELAKLSGRAHDPEKPIHLLGMKIYFFSWFTLCYLVDEIFLERQYAFTPDGDAPLIIDCGSNIGISILFFKKLLPRARVTGFEPDRKTFELLSRNVAENGLSEVFLRNVALAARAGEVTFFSDPKNPGSLVMSTVMERLAGEAHRVECVPLSAFIEDPVDLLKIDIEGAETAVMRELVESGALKNVKAMAMEYHHHLTPCEEGLPGMLRLLEENSFEYDLAAALPGAPGEFQDIGLRVYRKRS